MIVWVVLEVLGDSLPRAEFLSFGIVVIYLWPCLGTSVHDFPPPAQVERGQETRILFRVIDRNLYRVTYVVVRIVSRHLRRMLLLAVIHTHEPQVQLVCDPMTILSWRSGVTQAATLHDLST
jgi:hypothetical protein